MSADRMDAGPDLDAEVAERVMGDVRLKDAVVVGVPGHKRALRWKSDDELLEEPPPYSTSIEDAWRVVEKMRERGFRFYLDETPNESRAMFAKQRLFENATGAATPLVICLAALAALSSVTPVEEE